MGDRTPYTASTRERYTFLLSLLARFLTRHDWLWPAAVEAAAVFGLGRFGHVERLSYLSASPKRRRRRRRRHSKSPFHKQQENSQETFTLIRI